MRRKRKGTPIKKSKKSTNKKHEKILQSLDHISQEERLTEIKKDIVASKKINDTIKNQPQVNDQICLYTSSMYDVYPLLFFPEMSSWIYIDEFPNRDNKSFGDTPELQIQNFLSQATSHFKVAGYVFKEHIQDSNLVMYENKNDPDKFVMFFYNTKYPESLLTNSVFEEALSSVNVLYLSADIPNKTILSKVSYPLKIIATDSSLGINAKLTIENSDTVTQFLYHNYVKDITYSIVKCPHRTFVLDNIKAEAQSATVVDCFNILDMHYQSLDPEKLEILKEQEPTYYYTKADKIYDTGTEIDFNPEYEEPQPVTEDHNDDDQEDHNNNDQEDHEDNEHDQEEEESPKYIPSEQELDARYLDDHDTKKRLWDKLVDSNHSEPQSVKNDLEYKKILKSIGVKLKKNKNDKISRDIVDEIDKVQKSKNSDWIESTETISLQPTSSSTLESTSRDRKRKNKKSLKETPDEKKEEIPEEKKEETPDEIKEEPKDKEEISQESPKTYRKKRQDVPVDIKDQTLPDESSNVDVRPYKSKKRQY